ncbi:MAG: hypothetical protein IPM54_18705 [Polyangiaceae bacterium]|nr:hypothetical protein [Polyangiaceae bacterium]
MHPVAIVVCALWIAVATMTAAIRGVRGAKEGRLRLAMTRLKSPTIYLFAAYLLIAALVTPKSPGETTSPLMWLAFSIPLANALAVLSAAGKPKPSRAEALGLALLHGGAVLAAAALILAIASPQFVPTWLGGPGAPVELRQ